MVSDWTPAYYVMSWNTNHYTKEHLCDLTSFHMTTSIEYWAKTVRDFEYEKSPMFLLFFVQFVFFYLTVWLIILPSSKFFSKIGSIIELWIPSSGIQPIAFRACDIAIPLDGLFLAFDCWLSQPCGYLAFLAEKMNVAHNP